MRLSMSKRLEIGKIIYKRKLSVRQASIKYGISYGTAKEYLRIYRETNNLEPFLDQKPVKSFDEVLHYDVFQMKAFMVNYFYIPLDNYSSTFDSGGHEFLFTKVLQDKLINESINNIDDFIEAYKKGNLNCLLSKEELLECSLVYDFLNCKLHLLKTVFKINKHFIIDYINNITYQDWNIGVLFFDKKTEQKLYDLDICLLSDIILKEKPLDLQNDLYFQVRKRLIIYFYQVNRLQKYKENELVNLNKSEIKSSNNENINFKKVVTPINQEETAEYVIDHDKSCNHISNKSSCDIEHSTTFGKIHKEEIIYDEENNDTNFKENITDNEFNFNDDNIPIDCLNLSVRSYNGLRRYGINKLEQLKELSIKEIAKIPNLGPKSVEEIKSLLKRLGATKEWNYDYKIKNNNIYCISKNIFIKNASIDSFLLYKRLKYFFIKNNLFKISDLINYTNEDFDNNKIIGYKSIKEIKQVVLDYLQNPDNELRLENPIEDFIEEYKFEGCHKKDVLEKFSNAYGLDKVEKSLANLIEEKTVFEYEGKLFFRYNTFPQFLYKLEKSEDKDIMFRRMNGETLEEISNSYNVTRERIRQRQKKFVEKNIGDIDNPIHIFKEDRYRYIYENYELNKKEFCDIFNEKERTFNYLIMRYQKGKKDISEAAEDALIPNRLRGLIAKYGLRNFLLIDGEYIKKNRRSLLLHYLKKSNKIFRINDLVEQFNQYVTEIKLEEPENFIIDSRFLNGDKGFDKCILIKYPSSVRYYDFYNYDFSELLEEIDLDSFKNIQISTLKFFNKYPLLMEKYNINDEYELHKILKKIYDENPNERITFKRMPIIQIDDFDRNKYIVDTWKTNGYISQTKLSRIIAEEIGVEEKVAYIVWVGNSDVPELSKKINNNPILESEINFLSSSLIKPFYWIEEIEKISESFSDGLKTKIDVVNMGKVGYNLYNMYAIRKPLTATQYFTDLLLKNDIFYYPDFAKFKCISQFNEVYNDLKHELEIIEFENDRFITISKLSQFGYGKDKIKEIGNKIKNQINDYKYFTVCSLRNDGIDFEIDELGFSDRIIESIIKYTTNLEYIKIQNTYVFSTNKFSFLDIINDELCKTGKVETDDLIHILKEKYEIEVTKENIQRVIYETTIYYDSIMDSFYENYKRYLEDIC